MDTNTKIPTGRAIDGNAPYHTTVGEMATAMVPLLAAPLVSLIAPLGPIAQFSTNTAGQATGLSDGISPIGIPQDDIWNYRPENYRKSRAAFNNVRAGVANATIVRIGDSTEAGKGATGVGSVADARTKNPTVRFAQLLDTTILPCKANTFVSDNGMGAQATLQSFDTRISSTGATIPWFGIGSLFSNAFKFPGATSTLTLTADAACDSWEITYLDNSAAQWSWQIGSGATTTVTQGNTAALVKVVKTDTAATTLNLAWVSGNVGIMSVRAYNAAIKEASVYCAGILSAPSATFALATTYYSAINHLKFIAPDLTIIRIGVNDYGNATPVTIAAFTANLQATITAAQVSGDVILSTVIPGQDTGTMTLAGQQAYVDATYALAVANNCAVVDIWRRLGSYPLSRALYYSDAVHQNAIGYYDIAKAEYELVRRL